MMISRFVPATLAVGLLVGVPVVVQAADPAPAQPAQPAPAPNAPAPAAVPNPPASAAQALPAPTIMIVDVQRILQESTAAKGVTAAIESQRDAYQKEIEALETKARTAEQDLVKQKTVLAPDAFAKRQTEFQKQVSDLQRTVQARKHALDTALDTAMSQVQKSMVEIVEEVASEKGINLVMARHLFIIHATVFDQTDLVLKRLNERLPKVDVVVPKP
jgi:outer membrane protein